jgi:hypothetical protein
VTSRWTLNLVLAVILLLLGWAIRNELGATRIPPTLIGAGAPEPHRIEIARSGEPTLLLERIASGWRMRTPWDIDADAQRVAALLAIRDAPLSRSVPAQALALDDLGLQPVTLNLRLDTTDFALGGLDPIEQWRYLLDGDLVHLVPDRFHQLLTAPPIDYVARHTLARDPVPVFATLDGIPLSGETLRQLESRSAERLEPLAGEIPDAAVLELGAMDGTRVRYLLSADRRRWSRPDLNLTYLFAEPPQLIEDRDAVDPTPTRAVFDRDQGGSDTTAWPERDRQDLDADPGSFGIVQPTNDPDALMNPDAPLSGHLPLGPAPAVRLRPHEPVRDPIPEPGGFGAAMLRDPPEGFGLDPFAPQPDTP